MLLFCRNSVKTLKKLKLRIFLLDHIKDDFLFWESHCCFKICFLGLGNLSMLLSPLLPLPHRSLLSQNLTKLFCKMLENKKHLVKHNQGGYSGALKREARLAEHHG